MIDYFVIMHTMIILIILNNDYYTPSLHPYCNAKVTLF